MKLDGFEVGLLLKAIDVKLGEMREDAPLFRHYKALERKLEREDFEE